MASSPIASPVVPPVVVPISPAAPAPTTATALHAVHSPVPPSASAPSALAESTTATPAPQAAKLSGAGAKVEAQALPLEEPLTVPLTPTLPRVSCVSLLRRHKLQRRRLRHRRDRHSTGSNTSKSNRYRRRRGIFTAWRDLTLLSLSLSTTSNESKRTPSSERFRARRSAGSGTLAVCMRSWL